jgi:hypothetical protein
MSFSVKKKNGVLILTDHGGWETRNPSTMWTVKEADKKFNWKDFKEITICTKDYENSIYDYTYSKRNSFERLVPDFNFYAWPEVGINDYEEYVHQIDLAGLKPFTIDKVGWIGNMTHPKRRQLIEIGRENPDCCDFFSMTWFGSGEIKLNSTKYISTPDLVETYSMLIDVEGAGYSGRLKHLLWSNRPLLIVKRPHNEYFFEYLQPWVHFIPVAEDLSDLVTQIHWCKNNYSTALDIAKNARWFCNHFLTRDACYNQWNKIICDIK